MCATQLLAHLRIASHKQQIVSSFVPQNELNRAATEAAGAVVDQHRRCASGVLGVDRCHRIRDSVSSHGFASSRPPSQYIVSLSHLPQLTGSRGNFQQRVEQPIIFPDFGIRGRAVPRRRRCVNARCTQTTLSPVDSRLGRAAHTRCKPKNQARGEGRSDRRKQPCDSRLSGNNSDCALLREGRYADCCNGKLQSAHCPAYWQ